MVWRKNAHIFSLVLPSSIFFRHCEDCPPEWSITGTCLWFWTFWTLDQTPRLLVILKETCSVWGLLAFVVIEVEVEVVVDVVVVVVVDTKSPWWNDQLLSSRQEVHGSFSLHHVGIFLYWPPQKVRLLARGRFVPMGSRPRPLSIMDFCFVECLSCENKCCTASGKPCCMKMKLVGMSHAEHLGKSLSLIWHFGKPYILVSRSQLQIDQIVIQNMKES